jgi:hypothetical protein
VEGRGYGNKETPRRRRRRPITAEEPIDAQHHCILLIFVVF